MRRRILALCATAAVALTGCTGPDAPPGSSSCGEGGRTTVSGTGRGGSAWRTELSLPTDRPPQVSGGHVVVRHPCGFTVLDLSDGEVVRSGGGVGTVGLAGDHVVLVDDLRGTGDPDGPSYVVRAVDVDGGEALDLRAGYGAEQLRALVVGRSVLVVRDEEVLERHRASGPEPLWSTTLPVVRRPMAVGVDDVLVVASADGSVYGLARDDGTVLWRHTVETTKPSYAIDLRPRGSAVVVTARPGAGTGPEVVALDAATGMRLPGTPPPAPKVPPLVARGGGWTIALESEAGPAPGA